MKEHFAASVLLAFLLLSVTAESSYYYEGNISLIRNSTWSANLTGLIQSTLAFGDIDNDADLDIVSAGCSSGGVTECTVADKMRIYLNNGTSFVESHGWGQNLASLGYGSISFGDIDNDGDLDMAVMGDMGGGNGVVKIYTNNGVTMLDNQTWQHDLAGVDAYAGTIVFGDVNNDGRLDVVLIGAYPSSDNGIYINNGTSLVKEPEWITLPYVGYGDTASLSLGDINNDGYLDLSFFGFKGSFHKGIYINNGTSLEKNSSWEGDILNEWGWPSHTLGDYDNDGDLDLLLMGTGGVGGDKLYVFNNTDSSFIYHQRVSSFFEGSAAWGDYDCDGDLDLAAIGKEEGKNTISNNNGTYFQFDNTARADLKADDMQRGSLAWSDIDKDGDLDLACIGLKYGNGYLAKIYISNSTSPNTIPNPPTNGFSSNYATNKLSLSWGNGSDSETPTFGLYYNLRAGTSAGYHDIVPGIYGGSSNPASGYFGNMMQRKGITLNRNFDSGTKIYWAVQTIDTGLAKSEWSQEQIYTIPGGEPPSIENVRNITVTWNSAVILFDTDVQGNATINHGTIKGNLNLTALNSTFCLNHSVTLSSLQDNTTYYYNVTSCNSASNCSTSGLHNFTTAVCPPAWSCSSWGSCQPSNTQTCNSWADANNCGKSYSGSNTRSCTYSPGSSGTGPSYTPPATTKTYTFDKIEAGTPVTKEVTEGITVTIDAKETVRNVNLVVSTLAEKPSEIVKAVKGRVYQYFEINSSGITDENIEEAFIEFRVSGQWVSENNIDRDSITLYRYHGDKWQGLETESVSTEDGFYNYRAKIPGFSYFAIIGEEIATKIVCNNNSICEADLGENEENCPNDCVSATGQLCNPGARRCSGHELQECNPAGTVWVAGEFCMNGCDSATLACNPPAEGAHEVLWYLFVITVIAVAIITVVYLIHKKSREPETLEDV